MLNLIMFVAVLVGMFFVASASAPSLAGEEETVMTHFYKVCTHAHTTMSDGDSSPEFVAKWYQDHGYNALFITDHNVNTEIEDIPQTATFILIQGLEITIGNIHVNALGLKKGVNVEVPSGKTTLEILQKEVDAALAAGAIAQINHPNYQWTFGAKEISQLEGANLLEIYNASGNCNNAGSASRPSTEEIWDALLSQGQIWYGVASDDAHHYTDFSPYRFNPGMGWVMVAAEDLSPKAILSAISKGRFYASLGVELASVKMTSGEYAIKILPWSDEQYTTYFIGKNGEVLQTSDGLEPSYQMSGDEGYVRARIESSNGRLALTQPMFLK